MALESDTQMGKTIVPILEDVASSIGELVHHPEGVHFQKWKPIARLRDLRTILPTELTQAGWQGPLVNDLGLNISNSFLQQ